MPTPELRVMGFLSICLIFGSLVWSLETNQISLSAVLASASSGVSSPVGGDDGILCKPGQLYKVIIETGKDGTSANVRKEVTTPYKQWFCREQLVNQGNPGCQTRRCCRDGKCGGFCPSPDSSNTEFMEACRLGWYCQTAKGLDYLWNCGKGNQAPADDSSPDRIVPNSARLSPATLVSAAILGASGSNRLAEASTPAGSECGGSCVGDAMKNPGSRQPPGGSPAGSGGSAPPTLPGHTAGPTAQVPATPLQQQPNLPGGAPAQQSPNQPTNPVGSTGGAPASGGNSVPGSLQTSPSQRIDDIANSGSRYPAGGSQNTSQPAFNPSSALSNPLNFSSGFGSGGSNAGGGYTSGGSIAYAPQLPPVYYNRNFDSLGTPDLRQQQQPTVQDILGRLAANTPRQRTVVTASDLSGDVTSGGLGGAIAEIGSTLFTPVGQFVSSLFAGGPSEQKELAAVAADEKKEVVSFDEQRIQFDTLELILAPGDPRLVFDRLEDISNNQPTRTGNPFLDGVLVRTKPWSESDGSLSGYLVLGSDFSASDTRTIDTTASDNPSQELGDTIQDSFDAARSPNVFSAMRLTLGTVSKAVNDLFRNIFSTLFWWI